MRQFIKGFLYGALAMMLLAGAIVAAYYAFQTGVVVDISSEPPTTTLAPTTSVVPSSTTSTMAPATTTTSSRPDTPVQEADGPTEPQPWFTEASTVSIAAPSVGIDHPVDTFGWDGTNACGSQESPCVGRVNNFVDDDPKQVSACQQGVSLFAGHSVWGGPDSFSNIYDDKEHDWDDGLKAGDEVIVSLDDGSICHGVIRDFLEGPGEPVSEEVMEDPADAKVRFWAKSDLGQGVSRELAKMFSESSYGVLMASFCNTWSSSEDFFMGSDGLHHRRYNVAVLVEWTHVQTTDRNPEEVQ